jgi:ABC-type Zn uptake system ZnuABC Zn-binding protein ZnuA
MLLITDFVTSHQRLLNLTTAFNLFAVGVYVAYRSQNPEEGTLMNVQNELRKNNITQMVKYRTDHCQ